MNSPSLIPISLTADKVAFLPKDNRPRKTSNFFPSLDDSFSSQSSNSSSNSTLDLGIHDDKLNTFDFSNSLLFSNKNKEFLNPGFTFIRPSQTSSSLSSGSSTSYSTTKRHNSSPMIGSKFFNTNAPTNPPSTSSSSISTPMLFPMHEFKQPDFSQISIGYEEESFKSPTMFHSPIQSIWSNHPTPNINDITPKLNEFQFKNDMPYDISLKQDNFNDFPLRSETNLHDFQLKNEPNVSEIQYQRQYISVIDPNSSPELKKSFNIYLSRVNNPSFVPSNSITETREYINSTGPSTEHAHITNDSETLNKKIEKIDKLINKSKQKNVPVKVNLPKNYKFKEKSIKLVSPVNFNKLLLDQINSSSVKYQEDYCSTFYKRNKHKYMFIKESSNSLKVNNSGGKSWVTIKLNLNENQLNKKKLKVDIKNLPIWKPINLNQTSINFDKPKLSKSKKIDLKHNNMLKRFGKR